MPLTSSDSPRRVPFIKGSIPFGLHLDQPSDCPTNQNRLRGIAPLRCRVPTAAWQAPGPSAKAEPVNDFETLLIEIY